jgi:carbon catabolite-derepressing protein kinase
MATTGFVSSGFDDDELSMSLPKESRTGAQQRGPSSRQSQQQSTSSRTDSRTDEELAKDSRIRQRIGLYDVQKTLGEGSFGKVKLANHRVSGQQVALKIISRKKLISRDMAGRVEREIQYLQLLRHPHIIKL